MPWIIAILVVFMIVVLTGAFVRNALAIRRDVNRRFSEIQARLERDANSVLDDFLRSP
jgi:hypothetical protein